MQGSRDRRAAETDPVDLARFHSPNDFGIECLDVDVSIDEPILRDRPRRPEFRGKYVRVPGSPGPNSTRLPLTWGFSASASTSAR